MVRKPVLVPFVLAAISGTSAATPAPQSVNGLPSGLRDAVIDAAYAVAEGVASWVATETELVSGDPGQVSDLFGFSVAVSGDTAVVGAPGADPAAAYVFVRVGESWVLQQKLVATEPTSFGGAVAISGDTIVVGVVQVGIYVFQREGSYWNEQAKILKPDPFAEYFAESVAVSDDTILVGAPRFMGSGFNDRGAAYVFVRTGGAWSFQARLLHSDPESFDWFGHSVAVAGDTALIGAIGDSLVNGSNDDEGSATVFVRSGGVWTEEQLLNGGAQSDEARFGQSVAVWGDTALVGASLDDNSGGSNAGSAHVFVRSGTTWSKQQVLLPSGPKGNDNFGESVGLSGNLALVGADADDHVNGSGGNEGSAYVFANDGLSWNEVVHLTASDAETGDQFGQSVAISEDTAVVGAPFRDIPGATDAGGAYAFHLAPPPVTYCTAGASASGCQALLSASGTPSATAPSGFTLQASTVEGQKDGLFFFGTNGQQANPWGNSTSFQCVVPPVIRTSLLTGTGTAGLCDGAFSMDMNTVWTNQPAKNPGAAAVVQAQLWYRDPFNTANNQATSMSDAIEFVVAP